MNDARRAQDAERFRQVNDILSQALELEGRERDDFVHAACGDDEELRQEVDAMLAADASIGEDFIAGPLIPRDDGEDVPADRPTVGPYRLLKRLGAGGMGVVYLAERQEEFQQKVALKLIMRGLENQEIIDRFEHERQILANLQHPNIGQLLDGGKTDDDLPYFVMEYVEGQPINRFCKDRQASVPDRLELFRQVCEAVAFAHRNLVVHRDIKPANILVTEGGIPKLLDFGIAKLLKEDGNDPKTRLIRPLTTEYASPEQLAYRNVTTASDIYTLGILLYELLAGQRPYAEKETSPQTLLQAVEKTMPPPPSQIAGSDSRGPRRLSADLDAIVLKCLRAEPEQRYSSVEQLIQDLDNYRAGRPVQARKGTATYRFGKFARRNRAALIIAAITVGLLISSGFATLQRQVAEQQRAEKEREQELAEAFSDFMMRVLGDADPDAGRDSGSAHYEATGRMLERAEKESVLVLADQPLARAEILGRLGSVYGNRGQLDKALRLLQESEALRRQELGDEAPEVALVLTNQARVLREQEEIDEAKVKQEEALRILRLQEEVSLGKVGAGLLNLGSLEKVSGNYDLAAQHYRDAVEVLWQVAENLGVLTADTLSPDQHKALSDLIVAHNNLGSALTARGGASYDDAEEALREALELATPHSTMDMRRAAVLKNFGILRRLEGELESATWMLEESLAIRILHQQPESRVVTDTQREIALLEQAKGDHAMAADRLRQVIEREIDRYGLEHPRVARSQAYLGYSLMQLGDVQAEETLRQARQQLERHHGPNHPDVVQVDAWLSEGALSERTP